MMTPSEIEELRLQLGVSVSEMAAIIVAAPRDMQELEAGQLIRRMLRASIRLFDRQERRDKRST